MLNPTSIACWHVLRISAWLGLLMSLTSFAQTPPSIHDKPANQPLKPEKTYIQPLQAQVEENPNAVFIEEHFWPVWTYYSSKEFGEALYVPSPMGALMGSRNHETRPQPSPFALYSYERDEQGNIRQDLIFHIIQAKDTEEEQSVAIGPILKLRNDGAGNAARMEILGGLFALGHSKDGKQAGLTILGLDLMRDID